MKPKPTGASEERWDVLLGVMLFAGGIDYTACELCGGALDDPAPMTSELDITGRVT